MKKAIVFLCLLCTLFSYSQTIIEGKLIGKEKVGINVMLKGQNVGTITNQSGYFKIIAPKTMNNFILTCSFIGMTTYDIPIEKIEGNKYFFEINFASQNSTHSVQIIERFTPKENSGLDLNNNTNLILETPLQHPEWWTFDPNNVSFQNNQMRIYGNYADVNFIGKLNVDRNYFNDPYSDYEITLNTTRTAGGNFSHFKIKIDRLSFERANENHMISDPDYGQVVLMDRFYGDHNGNYQNSQKLYYQKLDRVVTPTWSIKILKQFETIKVQLNDVEIGTFNYKKFFPGNIAINFERTYGDLTLTIQNLEIRKIIVDENEVINRKRKIEQQLFQECVQKNDFTSYLSYYPTGIFKDEYLRKKEDYVYNTAKSKNDFDAYINQYPNGKYLDEMKERRLNFIEETCFKDAKNNLNFAVYYNKYPNGRYSSELKNFENNYAQNEFAQAVFCGKDSKSWNYIKSVGVKYPSHLESIQEIEKNYLKTLWMIGDYLVLNMNCGLILLTLEQWNENKSNVKVKVISNTDPTNSKYEGNVLYKENSFWIPALGLHKAINIEKEYAINNDKSHLILKDGTVEQCTNIKVGTTVYYDWSNKGGGLLSSLLGTSCTISFTVEEKNGNQIKCRVRNAGSCQGYWLNGQKMWNGEIVWLSCHNVKL